MAAALDVLEDVVEPVAAGAAATVVVVLVEPPSAMAATAPPLTAPPRTAPASSVAVDLRRSIWGPSGSWLSRTTLPRAGQRRLKRPWGDPESRLSCCCAC